MAIQRTIEEEYKIIVLLNNKSDINRYTLMRLVIVKNLSTNTIKSVRNSTKIYDNILWREVLMVLQEYKRVNWQSDHFITSIIDLNPNSIYYPIYDIKNEHKMIENYMQNHTKIKIHNGTPQLLKNGTGVYLDDTKDKKQYKIEYEEIKMTTLAIMYAIDSVKSSQFRELLKALEV